METESVLERGMWFVVCLQCDNNDNNNNKNDENERFTLKAKLCYPHDGVNNNCIQISVESHVTL